MKRWVSLASLVACAILGVQAQPNVVEELNLIHIRLDGFEALESWTPLPPDPAAQNRLIEPGPTPDSLSLQTDGAELDVRLTRPVRFNGSFFGISLETMASRPCVLSFVLNEGENRVDIPCPVSQSQDWIPCVVTPPSSQRTGPTFLWEGLKISCDEPGVKIAVRTMICHMWTAKAALWDMEVSCSRNLPVYEVGEPVAVEFRLTHRSQGDANVVLSASVDGKARAESSVQVLAWSLKRFSTDLSSLPEGLREVAFSVKPSDFNAMSWNRRLTILPPVRLAETSQVGLGAGEAEELGPLDGFRVSLDDPSAVPPWPMDERSPEDRLPWEGVVTIQGEKRVLLGWETPGGRLGVSEEEQSWNLAKALFQGLHSRGVQGCVWAQTRDAASWGGAGLIKQNGDPKPSLGMLVRLAALTAGGEAERLDLGEDMAGLIFKNQSCTACAIWGQREEATVAVKCSSPDLQLVTTDGSLRPFLSPVGAGEGLRSWTLLAVTPRPLILVAGPDQDFQASGFVRVLCDRPMVKPGGRFTSTLKFAMPEGFQLTGTVKACAPPEWEALPETVSIQTGAPNQKGIKTIWRSSVNESGRSQDVSYELRPVGVDQPLKIWSEQVSVTPLLDTSVLGTIQDGHLQMEFKVESAKWLNQRGYVRAKLGAMGMVRQDFYELRRSKPFTFRVDVILPEGQTRMIDMPCELSVYTFDRITKFRHDVGFCQAPYGQATIDGTLTDWTAFVEIPLGQGEDLIAFDGSAAPQDAQARIAWNENGILLGAEISDDVFHAASPGIPSRKADSLEFTLRAERQEWPSMCVGLSSTGILWDGGDQTAPSRWPAAIGRHGLQTTYEIMLPWTETGFSAPPEGASLLFGCGINDADEAGTERLVGWHAQSLLQPSRPIGLAKMTFSSREDVPQPTPPPAAP